MVEMLKLATREWETDSQACVQGWVANQKTLEIALGETGEVLALRVDEVAAMTQACCASVLECLNCGR
jgi:hypothetical protein